MLCRKLRLSIAEKIRMQKFAGSAHENTKAMIKVMDFIADLFLSLVDWSGKRNKLVIQASQTMKINWTLKFAAHMEKLNRDW